MNEKSLVPSIRFTGFTDAWERCKLGDLGKVRSGIGFPDAEQGGTEGLPFFKVSDMNISGNEHEMTKSQNYVSIEQIQRKKWTPILDVPALFFAKVGAAVLLNRKRLCRTPFLLDNNTMAYSVCGEKWNVDFAKALFDTVNLPSLIQVGALPSYNAGDVESLEITLPNIEEQNQIGHFFRLLDRLITLHQRKYEKLLNIKKSMLDKMFPKNGELFPEVRFAGFTDAWERRKLGEVVSISSGVMGDSLLSNGNYCLTRIETIADGVVDENKVGYTNIKPDDSFLLRIGDILYSNINSISHIGKVALFTSSSKLYHGINLLRIASNADVVVSSFLFHQLNTEEKKEWARAHANQAVSQASINQTLLAQQKISVCTLNEQRKIAEFLTNLDTLITLHQRKLEKLQNIKKACLEKMFV